MKIPTPQAAYFGGGTFAPFFRASLSPIAIACFRLVTRPPCPDFPLRSVPLFIRRTALFTLLPAAFPYRVMVISSILFPSLFRSLQGERLRASLAASRQLAECERACAPSIQETA
jgi:hypothetical protein